MHSGARWPGAGKQAHGGVGLKYLACIAALWGRASELDCKLGRQQPSSLHGQGSRAAVKQRPQAFLTSTSHQPCFFRKDRLLASIVSMYSRGARMTVDMDTSCSVTLKATMGAAVKKTLKTAMRPLVKRGWLLNPA